MSELNLMCLKGKKRELNDFNDWGGYMQAKIRKLDEQFEVMENSNDECKVLSDLFKNIVIFVNGYTVPSSDELKRLMKTHGGGFQHYYSRSKCTHIIATNLPDSKIKELKGEKVVHPDWILESIKAGKLLPYHKYLLYGAGRKYGENKSLKNVIRPSNAIVKASCNESSRKSEHDTEFATNPDLDEDSLTLPENFEDSSVHSDTLLPVNHQSGTSTSNEMSNSENCVDKSELLKDGSFEISELTKNDATPSLPGVNNGIEFPDQNEMVGNETEFTKVDSSASLKNDTVFKTTDENPVNALLKSSSENENFLLPGKSVKELTKESKANLTKPKKISGLANENDRPNSGHPTLPERRLRTKKSKSVPRAGDANFVNEYYTHSRLHYLSTWGAEFRDFINNLIQTTKLKTPKKSPQKSTFKKRVIMHIDMDSFFVSVALRSRPELRGKPVAVCHAGRGSNTTADPSFGSTSEIASCSYEARSLGVKNGMWLGQARQLCPALVCVSYQFDEYRQVSQQLYEILASYTHEIQAVSCDEAFVDLANYIETECLTALEVAQIIREEIKTKTNCPASAGIASNILLARMCTKVAKPNGQFHLQDDDTADFIGKQKVADLPGVGYALNQKLMSLKVITCTDLQRVSMSVLRREFGQKTGEMLFKYCRGQDDRQLKIERERKSVSAEINYAIRFVQESEPEKFIHDLSNEVHRRLKTAGVRGKQVTFKLRVRQKDAPINPTKFMGCGRCDNISRSTNMNSFTDDASVIARECISMLKQLSVPVSDIRGMGIQIGKLSDDSRKTSTSKTLHSFMKPVKALSNETTKNSGNENLDRGTLKVCEMVGETYQQQKLDGKSSKLTAFGTSQLIGETLDEFKLILSDDEEDASCDPRDLSEAHIMSVASCSKGQESICDVRSSTRREFPSLPVFPIFSPKRTSPSSKHLKFSPNLDKKKRTPRKSPRKSPSKSPGKLSSQRSLYSTFQSIKGSDATGSFVLPSPSQIDPAVFAELPEEIKKDIEISYQRKNLRIGVKVAERFSSAASGVSEEIRCQPAVPTKNLKQDHERNETKTKKSKVKHKSIKRFASKKSNKDDDILELDTSVLDALPESMRHEVQLAYEQQKRHDEKEKNKQLNLNTNACVSKHTEPRKEIETDMASLSAPKVTLAGAKSLSDVRKMLKLWTNDTQVPLDEDVCVLEEYLSNLIIHKDLEKMWLVLKCYRRLVAEREAWRPLFNRVLNSVQDILKRNYGGQVSMKHFVIF